MSALPPDGEGCADPTCTECGKVLTFEDKILAALERMEFLLETMAGMYDEEPEGDEERPNGAAN